MQIFNCVNQNINDLQIQTNVAVIGFTVQAADAAFENVKLGLKLVTRNGSKPIIDPTKLVELLDQESSLIGHYRKSSSAGVTTLTGSIAVSADGSLELRDGEYLSLSTTGTSASPSLKFWAIELGAPVRTVIQRVKIPVTGTTRNIDLTGVSRISYPAWEISEMVLQYAGHTRTLTDFEHEILQLRTNDVVFADGGTGATKDEFNYVFNLDVQNALSMKVTPAGSTTFDVQLLQAVSVDLL